MKENKEVNNLTKLDSRTKFSYTIGATGRDMAYTLVSMFLVTYIQYTMKLTVAQFSVISAIIFVCLIWDAINDPMMGIIIENSHLKRGKYRPWILLGVILNAIVIISLFSVRLEGWSFVVFFGFSYLLWGMTYTMNDIAYWGLLPSLSSNPKERNFLVTLMSVFICVGQFSVAGVLPTLVAGNAVVAYRNSAIVIALCFILFQLLTYFGVKERKRETQNQTEKLNLKKMFSIFTRNDQLIAVGISSLLYNIGSGLLIMFAMNFFYFEFGYATGGTYVFIFTVMYGLGTLLSQALFSLLSKYFKRQNLLLAMVILIVILYSLFLSIGYILPKNAILLNAIGFGIFFCQGLCNMIIIVMLNNTIEYDEYKYHERHDSIISAVRSFSAKLGSAINQGITAFVLIISGVYTISQRITELEILSGTGEISSDEVLLQAQSIISQTSTTQLLVLRIGMTLIPIAMIGLCCILLRKKYKIDEEEYDRIVSEIQRNSDN